MNFLFFMFLLLFCFQASADAIEVSSDKKENYGCTYQYDDFFRKKVPKEIVFNDDQLHIEMAAHQQEFYQYLKKTVANYHYYREPVSWSPGTFVETVFFDLNGERISFYAGGSDTEPELRIVGFCYEGNFDSDLVTKFMPRKRLQDLKVNGDGEYYFTENSSYSTIKIVKSKGNITRLYVYMDVE